MKTVIMYVGTIVCVCGMVGVASAVSTPYTADFESPTFSLGDVAGQDGWRNEASAGTAEIAAGGYLSSQALKLTGTGSQSNQARIQFADGENTGSQHVDFRMRISLHSGDAVTVAIRNRNYGQKTFNLVFNNANQILNQAENVSFGSFVTGEWFHVGAHLDYGASTYDLYIDDVLKQAGVSFAGAGTSMDEWYVLNAGGNAGTTTVEIDNLNLIPEPATMALLGLGGLLIRRRR